MRFRFSIRALLVLTAGVAVLLSAAYYWPKSHVLGLHPRQPNQVGYYRGLGLHPDRGYLGRNWYLIRVDDGGGCYWEVDAGDTGYCPYRGYYPNGTLREEGTCAVVVSFLDQWADRHDVDNARYYSPDGKLISEVKNGTGKQLLLDASGQKRWELDLVDHKYEHVRSWHDNGKLAHDAGYSGGVQHGPSVSYHDNGQIRRWAEHHNGERTGIWIEYGEDGTVVSRVDYNQQQAKQP